MQQQHPHGRATAKPTTPACKPCGRFCRACRPDHHSPHPFTLDIAALAALDAALARDHAAQVRAEATLDAAVSLGFAAALGTVGEATL